MTTDNRTNEGASAKAECAPHHWVSHHQDGLPVRWIEQCSLCGSFNAESLREQIYRSGGQFTEAQVEEAAVASINSCRSRAGLPTLGAFDGVPNADEWRADARAALVAAQGAVPQAEAYDHCCNHSKCPGGSLCCCASEQRLRDCWNQWREEVAGDTKQAFRDAYSAGRNDPAPWAVAPVLPSSGVDEDARRLIAWPTVDEVRGTFRKSADRLAFDRLIAEVERAAAEKAWDELAEYVATKDGGQSEGEFLKEQNPYRKAVQS